MPDNPVLQSTNDDPNVSLNPNVVSSIKGGLGGREWISDQIRDDKVNETIQHEVAPPLFETESAPPAVEKLPSVEISSTLESKEKVIKEAQKPDAQTPNKPTDNSPHIVNKTTGEEVTHHLRTADTLTTIADADEAEFIEEVEQHAHVH